MNSVGVDGVSDVDGDCDESDEEEEDDDDDDDDRTVFFGVIVFSCICGASDGFEFEWCVIVS